MDPGRSPAKLPDRILVLETKNLSGDLVGREGDATWSQRFGSRSFPFLNPLWQNALHLDAVRALVGSGVRVEGMVLMVGRGWFGGRMPDGCYRLKAFGERLTELGGGGPSRKPAQDRLDAAWRTILDSASRRLLDFISHGRMVEHARGRRRRAPAGLAHAIGSGVLLGLYLAG